MSDSDGGDSGEYELIDSEDLDSVEELEELEDDLDPSEDEDLSEPEQIGSENEDSSEEGSLELDYDLPSTTMESDRDRETTNLRLLSENEIVVRNTQFPTTVKDEERCSRDWLTMYELVRMIGTRTAELNGGAAPVIQGVEDLENTQIAHLEIKYGRCPIGITRHLPGGRVEHWKLSELKNYVSDEIVDSAYYVPELQEREIAAKNK